MGCVSVYACNSERITKGDLLNARNSIRSDSVLERFYQK